MRVANCVEGSSAFAIYAAFFFDPRGRAGPCRRLRLRRPFFARVAVETLPSNDWIAERTSCWTMSRITVNKLFCLGIDPLPAGGRYTNVRAPACGVPSGYPHVDQAG